MYTIIVCVVNKQVVSTNLLSDGLCLNLKDAMLKIKMQGTLTSQKFLLHSITVTRKPKEFLITKSKAFLVFTLLTLNQKNE